MVQKTMELLDLLRTVELFDGLDDDQLKCLAKIGESITVNKGEVIFAQGDQGDCLYIVCDGQVQVQLAEEKQNPNVQVYLGRGQIFGEIALIDGGPRSATMMCMRNDTLLHAISREAFADLCKSDTAIGYKVMRNMAADLSFKLRHRNLAVS